MFPFTENQDESNKFSYKQRPQASRNILTFTVFLNHVRSVVYSVGSNGIRFSVSKRGIVLTMDKSKAAQG